MNKIFSTAKSKMGDAMERICKSYLENLHKIKNDFNDCSDFNIKEFEISKKRAFVAVMDGLVSSLALSQLVMSPLLSFDEKAEEDIIQQIKSGVVQNVEMSEVEDFDNAYYFLMSGFAILIVDGSDRGLALGIQGWAKRNVSDPSNEANVKGAKEGFVECLNDNKALLRKRLKTSHLKMRQLCIGKTASTGVVIAYIDNRAQAELVDEIEKRITGADFDCLLDYGMLLPFLDTDVKSFFSCVGNTERPDVAVSKLLEGRVVVLVDSTPFAIYLPYLFSDNFQSLDDYDNPPFYSGFIRLIKAFSFLLAVFLPAVYVAVGTFHQELMSTNLLFTIAAEEITTPFSLMTEALFLLIFYEIMREAGLRLPRTVGHAVSIIGGIIIGETSVEAGLIGAPMLVVVAITAIASYVVYPLYESVSVIRFAFILAGGIAGLYGMIILAGVMFINICALNPFGTPLSAPFSPYNKRSGVDMLYRANWKILSKRRVRINELRGASFDTGKTK